MNSTDSSELKGHRGLIGLSVGVVLLLFANGFHSIPLFAWIAPIFVVRFVRSEPRFWTLPLVYAVLLATWLFQFAGGVPLPLIGMLAVAATYALLNLLPYVLDRWLYRKLPVFTGTLVFPCAVVAVELAICNLSPYGSWGAVAYSQYGNLALMQLGSETGLYGISFIVSWTAGIVNAVEQQGFMWGSIRKSVTAFITVVLAIYIVGEIRLDYFAPGPERIRVAALTARRPNLFAGTDAERRFWVKHTLTTEEYDFAAAAMARSNQALLDRTTHEAEAGAQLIVWNEGAATTFGKDEASLITKAGAVARQLHVSLGMAAMSFNLGQPKLMQNKLFMLGTEGQVLYEYWKARPVPGMEAMLTETNGNVVVDSLTQTTRIGTYICFDLDFPNLIRHAGQQRIDLLAVPANDWAAIDPWHSQMTAFRAIENGVNLVRSTSNGRSMAFDYQGRVLSQADDFTNADHVMIASVPTHGVPTVYATIGDLFAWLCIVILAGLITLGILQQRSK